MGANDDPWDQPTGTTGPIDAEKALDAFKDLLADGTRVAARAASNAGIDDEGNTTNQALLDLGEVLHDVADTRDRDHDGLDDGEERVRGSNPRDPDSDRDRLPDGAEVHVFKSDPMNADSDWDGRPDGDEAGAAGGIWHDDDGQATYIDVPEVLTPHRPAAPAPESAPPAKARRPAPEPEVDSPGPVLSPSEVDPSGPITSPDQVDAAAVLPDDITGSDAVAMSIGGPGVSTPAPIVGGSTPSTVDGPAPEQRPADTGVGIETPVSPEAPFEPAEVQFPEPSFEDPMPPEDVELEGDFTAPVVEDGTAIADAEPPPDDLSFA
jgi:hypothetical protein